MPNQQRFINILLLLTLSACGWQLRDSGLLSADIGTVHLSSNDTQSYLTEDLRRALDKVGVSVVDLSSQADYSIVIVNVHHARRTSTLNSGGRAAEYQLNQDVDFLIVDQAGKQLIPQSTVSIEKVFEFDEQDVLASANEERIIKQQMDQETVRQILNRLSQLALNNTAPQ